MSKLKILNVNGKLLADSREVAVKIGKDHKNLMRDIRSYESIISESSNLSSQDFFIKDTYKVPGNNKTYDCYLLTRKGCDMVANKMTGEKGILFTAEYVTSFDEMESKLRGQAKALSPLEQLQLQNQAILQVNDKVDKLEKSLPLLGVDCDEITKTVKSVGTNLLGYRSNAYNDKSIRSKVYADIYSQLKREFQVNSYKAIKRCELEKALDIIKNYKLPYALNELINNAIQGD